MNKLIDVSMSTMVAVQKEFKNEQEVLDFFGLAKIEFRELRSEKVPFRAEIYYKNNPKPLGVPLFVNEDQTYRTIIDGSAVVTAIDQGREWKDNQNRKRIQHDVYVPNAILEYAVIKANTTLPKPKVVKTRRPVSSRKPVAPSIARTKRPNRPAKTTNKI